MFEHVSDPLPPRRFFILRLLKGLLASCCLIGASLLIGIIGYRHFEGLAWVDSFLNASMILGGMGEVDALKTHGGKIFAGIYALYSGLVVIAVTGILLSSVLHRILHAFHQTRKNQE